MTFPRGFTRCDECGGRCSMTHPGATEREHLEGLREEPCPSCSGSGLVPTEKLREDVIRVLFAADFHEWLDRQADAVLRKVAEHIGEER